MKCDLRARIYLGGGSSDWFKDYRTPLSPPRAAENAVLGPTPGSLTAGWVCAGAAPCSSSTRMCGLREGRIPGMLTCSVVSYLPSNMNSETLESELVLNYGSIFPHIPNKTGAYET